MDHYLFLLKNFLGNLLMPVSFTLLLLFWALLLLLRSKTRWLGMIVVLLTTGLLFVGSYSPLANQYIAWFETRVPAYQQNDNFADYVAVLGHWHQSAAGQPLTSELSSTAIVRLVEGIRIYRTNPGSKLIFTGFEGVFSDPVSFPDKLRQLAIDLGVPAADILIFNGPRDTAEEVELIADKFGSASLVLVTSAAHMSRALYLFHRAGLDPTPAPTQHLSKPLKSWWVLPDGSTLARSESCAHEQIGLIWTKLVYKVEKDIINN